ncbi:MAG: hypothetical protein HY072_02965 [Deltaproteobacteria bacterium]|nr:hypothetical protein [Deltaproteobacteria bacterium]
MLFVVGFLFIVCQSSALAWESVFNFSFFAAYDNNADPSAQNGAAWIGRSLLDGKLFGNLAGGELSTKFVVASDQYLVKSIPSNMTLSFKPAYYLKLIDNILDGKLSYRYARNFRYSLGSGDTSDPALEPYSGHRINFDLRYFLDTLKVGPALSWERKTYPALSLSDGTTDLAIEGELVLSKKFYFNAEFGKELISSTDANYVANGPLWSLGASWQVTQSLTILGYFKQLYLNYSARSDRSSLLVFSIEQAMSKNIAVLFDISRLNYNSTDSAYSYSSTEYATGLSCVF